MIRKYKKAQSGSSINGGSDFEKAFAAARKAGKKTFTFKGKSYNTNLKTPPKAKVVKKNNSLTPKQKAKLEDADNVARAAANGVTFSVHTGGNSTAVIEIGSELDSTVYETSNATASRVNSNASDTITLTVGNDTVTVAAPSAARPLRASSRAAPWRSRPSRAERRRD